MHKKDLLPCSIKHACRLLSQDNHADKTGLEKRLKTVPKSTYLAIDIFSSQDTTTSGGGLFTLPL